jgi:hypothetical protein
VVDIVVDMLGKSNLMVLEPFGGGGGRDVWHGRQIVDMQGDGNDRPIDRENVGRE